ncbi:MAG: hypothetical protein QW324_07960 [Thermofilaceae archaeon]
MRTLKNELGLRSVDDVLRNPLLQAGQRPRPLRQMDGIFIEVLESVAMLRDAADADPSAVIVFIERKLSPLVSQIYNFALARLRNEG